MNTAPFYIRRSSLARFSDAIKNKKEVTIGFIGGSITDPREHNRWSEFLINELMAEYPDVRFRIENAAIGSTGSDYAVFRVEKDIIQRSCDLVFIEFAVNDNMVETPLRNASREGLIRKLLHGCSADLVISYTYCADMLPYMLEGRLAPTVSEFEELAEYYKINSVFMADYTFAQVRRGRLRWEEWLPDGLHPANTGSRYYASPVFELLKSNLETTVERDMYNAFCLNKCLNSNFSRFFIFTTNLFKKILFQSIRLDL